MDDCLSLSGNPRSLCAVSPGTTLCLADAVFLLC